MIVLVMLNMRSLPAALVFALVGACAPWSPEEFPVKVDVGADLSDVQRQALLDGIDMLEERVGADVFEPVESTGRRIQRGRIGVRSGVSQHGYDGWYDRNHWSCKVELGRQSMYAQLALHELLHCLGLRHDVDVDDSVMNEYAGRTLMAGHVDSVRALMGLGTVVSEDTPSAAAPVSDGSGGADETVLVAPPDFTIPEITVRL
jgi:hypothetical protein